MVKFVANAVGFLRPRRRWFQFSLGTLLIGVTLFGVWLGYWVDPVHRLEQELSDESEDVRYDAARKLGWLGRQAKGANDSLAAALKDESAEVRAVAAWAISRVGGDVRRLAPSLSDADDNVRLAAAEAVLWAGGDPAKVIPTLLDLKSGIAPFGPNLFSALGREPAAAAIPALLNAIGGDDQNLASNAVFAITALPLPAATATGRLIEALRNESRNARIVAAEQLGRLGPEASEAAGALRAGMRDADPYAALAAAAALGAVVPGDRESLAALKTALRAEDDPHRQMRAAAYVAALDPVMAAGAVEELVQVMDHESTKPEEQYVGWTAVLALRRIGPHAVPSLVNVLTRGANLRARAIAARVLQMMEPPPRAAIPALVPLLDDPDGGVRMQAASTLAMFGKEGAAAVPLLCKVLPSDPWGMYS